MSRTIRERDRLKIGAHLIRAGELLQSPQGRDAFDHAEMLSARGFPSGGDGIKGADDTSSTERAALDPDRMATLFERLSRLAVYGEVVACEVIDIIVELTPDEEQRKPKLRRVSSLIECANPHCDHSMTGIGDDRPRRGRCPRCAKHFARHDIDWPHRAERDAAPVDTGVPQKRGT